MLTICSQQMRNASPRRSTQVLPTHRTPPSGETAETEVPVELFDAFVDRADHSMVVVTTATGSDLHGCLVGFHSQVSIEPRRYAVLLSNANDTYRAANASTQLAVNLLGVYDRPLASLFGERTSDGEVDKFDQCTWRRPGGGPPVIESAVAWFIGTIIDRVPMGDHTAFVLAPNNAGGDGSQQALRYRQVRNMDAGH